MRILVTFDFPPQHGGIQRYLHDIVRFCYAPPDRVIVCSSMPGIRDYPFLKVPVVWLRSPSWLPLKITGIALFIICLLRYGRRGTVVECGTMYAAVAARAVSFVRKMPFRIYTYGTELTGLTHDCVKNRLFKSIMRRAECLYALGGFTQSLLTAAGISTTVVLCPPKISLPARVNEDSDSRPEIGASEGLPTLRILCVGRLVKHKGQTVLLDAVSQLPDQIPWELRLVGSGPMHSALMRHCRDKNIEKRVRFLENLTDKELAGEYRWAGVLAVPSLELASGVEGFGIVMLEAMAYRVPVVAFECGGIPEVLDGGRCGVLVEPGNAGALAVAILSLFQDRKMAESYAQRAYEHLVRNYVWRE